MNIVLIGFMGTGKSAVGGALARHLDWLHRDTDAEIEREAGKGIPQIFAEEGEAAFRAQETAFLAALAGAEAGGSADGNSGAFILSTGGGTPLRAENAALLRQIGTVIWLQATPEVILARVGRALAERPLLAGYADDPRGRIESLLAERAPHYAALADCTVPTSDCASPEDAAMRVCACLPDYPDNLAERFRL